MREVFDVMMKSNATMKYAGAAMAVGGTVMLGAALIGQPSLKKKAKKTAGKAIDAMDAMLTSVQHFIK